MGHFGAVVMIKAEVETSGHRPFVCASGGGLRYTSTVWLTAFVDVSFYRNLGGNWLKDPRLV